MCSRGPVLRLTHGTASTHIGQLNHDIHVHKKGVHQVYHRQLAEPDVVSTAVQQQIKNGVPVYYGLTEETQLNESSASTASEAKLPRVATTQSLEEQVLEVLATNHDIELQTLADTSDQSQTANLSANRKSVSKSYSVTLAGGIGSDRSEMMTEAISRAWCEKYNVNSNDVCVEVDNMDVIAADTLSGDNTTEVTYTVTSENTTSDLSSYCGLDAREVEGHFRSSILVHVKGSSSEEQWNSNEGTTPLFSISVPGQSSPSAPPPQMVGHVIQTTYFTGNISDRHQHTVENILLSAMCKAMDETCSSINVEILEKSNYVDSAGNTVTGYSYNVTMGAGEVLLSPEQSRTFRAEVIRSLQTLDVTTGEEEVGLYTGSVDDLKFQGHSRQEEHVVTFGGSNSDDMNSYMEATLFGTQSDEVNRQVIILDNSEKESNQWVSFEAPESGIHYSEHNVQHSDSRVNYSEHHSEHNVQHSSTLTVHFEKKVVTDSPDVYILN